MGKAQSKRSVDITTENKEGVAVAEGESGKVGKIEEVDQKPQLNGDANKEADSGTNEKQEEKKDEAENEKDAATEKSEQPAVEAEATAAVAAEATPSTETKVEEKPAEGGDGTENPADTTTGTLDESKDGVENVGDETPATDSAKKPKKEKSKKRFLSFRSFSFSKKDKTKPKKEETAANTTNGECEKVPEEGAEDAAAVTPTGDEKTEDAPVTNGTTDEVKTNGEQAPVATPEESVTPPSNGESKPIVEAAKETVDEVIVAASKSVDEKLNTVAKPEVNKTADQDLQETHTQALDTAVNESTHEQSLSNENANIDTVPNNIVDTDTVSVGVVDCTNNSSNNDNINSQSAPPLPDSPPPSQITVFAETAMSVDLNQVENPQTLPIIHTETIAQESSSALVGDTKIDECISSIVLDDTNKSIVEMPIDAIEDKMLATSNEQIDSQINENDVAIELPKSNDQIAETIAILDRVNLNESDKKLDENIVATETNTEPESQPDHEQEPHSVDISSPLPQNSLDTLPSPQSLSSNVTPPNEIDDCATVELAQEDTSSLPPPPPVDEIATLDKPTEKQCDSDAIADVAQNGNDDMLPPPPAQEPHEDEIIDELKTNGVNAEQHNQNHSVEAISGDGILNGSSKEHDEAVNNISDKANGVGNDNSVSEKLNGDHKTIEEIATSPEKLEKLAAANPPPSTEVVAAE